MTDTALDEIMAELEEEDVPCTRCARPMVSPNQWAGADEAERDELRSEGYVRTGSRGVCASCTRTMPREEYLALPKRPAGKPEGPGHNTLLMVKEVDAHLKDGGILADIAGRYPVKPDSIRRAMARARRRGDIQ